MEKISNRDLTEINGGGISLTAVLGITALVTFLLGVFDGYVNPQECN